MIEYVIGVDPDCKKSGFAFYKNEKLVSLRNWSFREYLNAMNNEFEKHGLTTDNTIFVIEDGNLIRTIFKKHRDSNKNVYAEKGRNVGRVQQQATCLIDVAKELGYTVHCMKPMTGNWADPAMTPQFKQATRWTKRSNPETRSAAFFGFIGLRYAKANSRKIK